MVAFTPAPQNSPCHQAAHHFWRSAPRKGPVRWPITGFTRRRAALLPGRNGQRGPAAGTGHVTGFLLKRKASEAPAAMWVTDPKT